MAVQQRRVSKSRKGMRKSHLHLDPKQVGKCKKCGKPLPNRGGPKSEGYTPTAESHRSSSNPEGRKTSVSKQKLGAPRIRL